jgi:hypothetical protein
MWCPKSAAKAQKWESHAPKLSSKTAELCKDNIVGSFHYEIG